MKSKKQKPNVANLQWFEQDHKHFVVCLEEESEGKALCLLCWMQNKKRSEKPEVRDAAKEAALREIKKTKEENKAKKAEIAAKQ
ncbi:hypothetical protein QQP08_024356 [Theobroma cacao]|nr:hypothetical protein QQP08_024356 [Theobroma cacao]